MKKAWIPVAALVIACAVVSCKKEKRFADPERIFAKWAEAIRTLNYADYASCEAFPKSEGAFREIYRDTYYADLMVTEIEKENRDVHNDLNGLSYVKRNVAFECTEVRRRDQRPIRLVRGDVDFIRYLEGDRAKRGWVMWNRKMIRIDR